MYNYSPSLSLPLLRETQNKNIKEKPPGMTLSNGKTTLSTFIRTYKINVGETFNDGFILYSSDVLGTIYTSSLVYFPSNDFCCILLINL